MNNTTTTLIINLIDRTAANNTVQIDHNSFHSPQLARACIDFYRSKYEKGVSLLYLKVLTTAFAHYDDFLFTNSIDDPFNYDADQMNAYEDYLLKLSEELPNGSYSQKYIIFLLSVPQRLLNHIAETGGNYAL